MPTDKVDKPIRGRVMPYLSALRNPDKMKMAGAVTDVASQIAEDELGADIPDIRVRALPDKWAEKERVEGTDNAVVEGGFSDGDTIYVNVSRYPYSRVAQIAAHETGETVVERNWAYEDDHRALRDELSEADDKGYRELWKKAALMKSYKEGWCDFFAETVLGLQGIEPSGSRDLTGEMREPETIDEALMASYDESLQAFRRAGEKEGSLKVLRKGLECRRVGELA